MPNGQPTTPTPPQPLKETFYINFFSFVDTTSVSQLMVTIQQALKQGAKKFCIFLSSTGGNVMSGITAYNFLKNLPNEITTYNYTNVDSSAILIFCAGDNRYCLPKSRFLLHEVSVGKIQGTEKVLQDNLKVVGYDTQRYIDIVAETTGQEKKRIKKDMKELVILKPEEAKEYKLVQEVKEELPPLETETVTTISVWPQAPQPQ